MLRPAVPSLFILLLVSVTLLSAQDEQIEALRRANVVCLSPPEDAGISSSIRLKAIEIAEAYRQEFARQSSNASRKFVTSGNCVAKLRTLIKAAAFKKDGSEISTALSFRISTLNHDDEDLWSGDLEVILYYPLRPQTTRRYAGQLSSELRDESSTSIVIAPFINLAKESVAGNVIADASPSSALTDLKIVEGTTVCNEPLGGRDQILINTNTSRKIKVTVKRITQPAPGNRSTETNVHVISPNGHLELGCSQLGMGAPVIFEISFEIKAASYMQ